MDYTYNSTYTTNESDPASLFVLGLTVIIMIGVALIFYIFFGLCLSKIFKKAGITPWYGWVPMLNSWKFLEMGGQNGALSLLALIPILNIVASAFQFIAVYRISKDFGKDPVLYLIIAILAAPVWYGMLAFDDSVWRSSEKNSASNPSNNKTEAIA